MGPKGPGLADCNAPHRPPNTPSAQRTERRTAPNSRRQDSILHLQFEVRPDPDHHLSDPHPPHRPSLSSTKHARHAIRAFVSRPVANFSRHDTAPVAARSQFSSPSQFLPLENPGALSLTHRSVHHLSFRRSPPLVLRSSHDSARHAATQHPPTASAPLKDRAPATRPRPRRPSPIAPHRPRPSPPRRPRRPNLSCVAAPTHLRHPRRPGRGVQVVDDGTTGASSLGRESDDRQEACQGVRTAEQ